MKRQYILMVALVLIVGVVGVFWFARNATSTNQSYGGTELDGIAPDFRLMDQNGTFVSLSDFRGKVVVLTFMDSQCSDTCPITGAHFRQAYKGLGQNEASQVVFLGINVNVKANTVANALETTRAWHMDEIPSWHFLTGEAKVLEPVWNAYGVAALPQSDGSITHTPGTFLIDPFGKKRWYISTPFSAEDRSEPALPLSDLLVQHIREILRDS